jgi:hypothetical protein
MPRRTNKGQRPVGLSFPSSFPAAHLLSAPQKLLESGHRVMELSQKKTNHKFGLPSTQQGDSHPTTPQAHHHKPP